MNKLNASLLFLTMMGMSSLAFAGWSQDCKQIEQEGPAPGLCNIIQGQITNFEAYAPLKPFHDLSVTGSGLDSKFPWGTPVWATGSGSGGGAVLTTGGTTGGDTGSSYDSSGSGTFQ